MWAWRRSWLKDVCVSSPLSTGVLQGEVQREHAYFTQGGKSLERNGRQGDPTAGLTQS